MKQHTCHEGDYCICYPLALEPDDNCYIHGWPFPPRCIECGRFIKQNKLGG